MFKIQFYTSLRHLIFDILRLFKKRNFLGIQPTHTSKVWPIYSLAIPIPDFEKPSPYPYPKFLKISNSGVKGKSDHESNGLKIVFQVEKPAEAEKTHIRSSISDFRVLNSRVSKCGFCLTLTVEICGEPVQFLDGDRTDLLLDNKS